MATRGRAPRKRSPSAGTSVAVKPHRRTPRGSNRGKPAVIVKGYKRGKPSRKGERRATPRKRARRPKRKG